MSDPFKLAAVLEAKQRGQEDAARRIAGWARQLAEDYEALAGLEVNPTDAGSLTDAEIDQRAQNHDQFVGAAAAMRAMVEKIEREFSL